MILPSFLEGRGTCVISWKYFQTIFGLSSVISIVLNVYSYVIMLLFGVMGLLYTLRGELTRTLPRKYQENS